MGERTFHFEIFGLGDIHEVVAGGDFEGVFGAFLVDEDYP